MRIGRVASLLCLCIGNSLEHTGLAKGDVGVLLPLLARMRMLQRHAAPIESDVRDCFNCSVA